MILIDWDSMWMNPRPKLVFSYFNSWIIDRNLRLRWNTCQQMKLKIKGWAVIALLPSKLETGLTLRILSYITWNLRFSMESIFRCPSKASDFSFWFLWVQDVQRSKFQIYHVSDSFTNCCACIIKTNPNSWKILYFFRLRSRSLGVTFFF